MPLSAFNANAQTKKYSPVYSMSQDFFYGEKDNIQIAEEETAKAYDEMQLETKKTDVDKLFTIYRWMSTNYHFDRSNDRDDSYFTYRNQGYSPAYTLLVYKVGVCTSYAHLFKYFCLNCGFSDVETVESPIHVWNIVKIDNLWYHIDVSASGGISPLDFLRTTKEMPTMEPEYQTSSFLKAHPFSETAYPINNYCEYRQTPYQCDFDFEIKQYCGSDKIKVSWSMPSEIIALCVIEKHYTEYGDSGNFLGNDVNIYTGEYYTFNVSPSFEQNYYGYKDNINSLTCNITEDTEIYIEGVDENYHRYLSPVKVAKIDVKNDKHDYTVTKDTQPSCTQNGEYVEHCSKCGYDNITTRKALGHNADKVYSKTDASCTEDGVYSYHCSRCEKDITETTNKLGHNYKKVVSAPTCIKQGCTTHKCSRCGNSYADNYTEALGHKWNSGKIKKQPTFKAAGTKTFTCSVCKKTKNASVAKLISPTVSKLTAGKKQFTATWKKAPTVAGYEIQYATNSKFSKAKRVVVKGDKTTKKAFKNLSAKKKYYVRVRAYKTINGKKVYSTWSKAKSVTTKK